MRTFLAKPPITRHSVKIGVRALGRGMVTAVLAAATLATTPHGVATASATAGSLCGTTSFDEWGAGEFPLRYWYSYVGSAASRSGTLHYWHITGYDSGSYASGHAVLCDGGTAEQQTVLYRPTVTSGVKCGTADFTIPAIDRAYTYIGSRLTGGHWYRYWRVVDTSQNFADIFPDAAKCS